ncbi:MAG: cytochrome c [Acidobacteriota bacterium]
MPRWIHMVVAVVTVSALVPLAFIARARFVKSETPRIHLIGDMDQQPKFRAQSPNALFADGRAMRPAIPGTVARGALNADDHFYRGEVGGQWAVELPMEVDETMMKRGQERFGVFCSPCHGLAGAGDGIVSKRADRLQEGTWTPPPSYHTDAIRSRPVGQIFNTITNGVRTMPAYGPQIPEADRWAIVAYVRALQRSQNSRMEDVPPELRAAIR